MMISKLITILGTITFSFLIAANDMLTIINHMLHMLTINHMLTLRVVEI